MAAFDRSLLETEQETLYKQLLLESGLTDDDVKQAQASQVKHQTVAPTPGFCLKTKTDDGEKVFINICMGDNLPVPREISDDDLLELLSSEDPSGFRIPLSIGEAHAEVDKSGKGCAAYDVIINPEFYVRLQGSQVLLGFFLTVVLEGLENKYSISLDREWKILKNRKFVGSLPEQNIRAKGQSKPWIMEMDSDSQSAGGSKSALISEISPSQTESERPKAPEPPYTIMQEPAEGHPEFLVAEIHLPKIKSPASLTLDIGEDRILLQTRSNIYHLDVYLPFDLLQEDCAAQFNRKTQILTLTLPVQPKVNS